MKKFRPLGDYVIVKPFEALAISKGGIEIPEEARERRNEGIIITLGTGPKAKSGEIKVGDEVIFQKYEGMELVEENGDKCLFMAEGNLLVGVNHPEKRRKKK